MNPFVRRSLRAPLVGLAIAVLAVGTASLTATSLVPKASAYVLSNGCDEYDPATATTYTCTPDRTTFYTPDGVDPSKVAVGTGYPGETGVFEGQTIDGGGAPIPPPAPYVPGRDYCSNWLFYTPYEPKWQYSCYRHDVCYGSQWGRKFCDVRFWHNMVGDCKRAYGFFSKDRYLCFGYAVLWYGVVRAFGWMHYRPRTSSEEPKGE